jgi:hypothetical protein
LHGNTQNYLPVYHFFRNAGRVFTKAKLAWFGMAVGVLIPFSVLERLLPGNPDQR